MIVKIQGLFIVHNPASGGTPTIHILDASFSKPPILSLGIFTNKLVNFSMCVLIRKNLNICTAGVPPEKGLEITAVLDSPNS